MSGRWVPWKMVPRVTVNCLPQGRVSPHWKSPGRADLPVIRQTFAEPQVRHLGIARPVKHPKLGDIKVVGQPINLYAPDSPGAMAYKVLAMELLQGDR